MMYFVPTLCVRSSNAGLDESAAASLTDMGPGRATGSALTPSQSVGHAVPVFQGLDRVKGIESGGTQIGQYPFSLLVATFMPCLTAAASTYGLNEDPTWFLDC